MIWPWMLCSQNAVDHGRHHGLAMDALFSERSMPCSENSTRSQHSTNSTTIRKTSRSSSMKVASLPKNKPVKTETHPTLEDPEEAKSKESDGKTREN